MQTESLLKHTDFESGTEYCLKVYPALCDSPPVVLLEHVQLQCIIWRCGLTVHKLNTADVNFSLF